MLKKILNRKQQEQIHPFLKKKFRLSEILAEYIIRAVSFSSFAVIILIFIFVFRETLPIFLSPEKNKSAQEEMVQETYGEDPANPLPQEYSSENSQTQDNSHQSGATFSNLMGDNWQPVGDSPKYGLWPLFVGSFKVTIISVLIAAPIAILAALFTAVLAPGWLKEIIKPTIELLAGFPSVVIGFFALVVIATLFQDLFGYQYRLNSFIGGLALSLAVIPIIYTVTDDALNTVPKLYSEASLALGATKWQTALFVVLPAATPGIFAAILLGVGRAFGETMIVLMATGNASLMSFGIFEPVRTMSATIGAEMAEVVFGDTHYNVLFLIGSILFVFTFVLNAIAEFYVRKRLLVKFGGA
ncbi:MAG: phosphate ABC transporter permease subunit PstC [Bacteroidota bacterium]